MRKTGEVLCCYPKSAGHPERSEESLVKDRKILRQAIKVHLKENDLYRTEDLPLQLGSI
ncbi:MAG: hypothetical protein ACOX0F_09905 [Syntrophomonadaceae bacterium]|jgi:hypothetical protein